MKRSLLLSFSILFSAAVFAQSDCSDLFISEYLDGYGNNKALEIYNPTSQPINLSAYSIARFSNGSTSAPPPSERPASTVQLPNVVLQPRDVYVVVLDKRDMSQWDSQLEKPVWNGYNVIDTIFDQVSGDPVLDQNGNVLIGPQYVDNGNGPSAIFGNVYNEIYDLQGKADVFLCPVYDINRAMYFNGNDAVVLLKGTQVEPDGSNLVDVIGVIGDDPTVTIMEDAWVDANGFWITKDRTIVRKRDIKKGRITLTDVIYSLGGTFDGAEWESYPKNSFCYMGVHICDCDPNPPAMPNTTECFYRPASSVGEINTIPFEIFPNPLAGNTLTISSEAAISTVEIMNILGQKIQEETFRGQQTRVNFSVNEAAGKFLIVKVIFENNSIGIQKLIREN